MAKGCDYFLSLDDKPKQRYKLKINNIQGYDPYQIKKRKNFLTILVHFHQCSDISNLLVNYFLFSLSPLTKEELKALKSLESYNQFTSKWVKVVKINNYFKFPVEITLVIGRVST